MTHLTKYISHDNVDAVCFSSTGNFTLGGKAVLEHADAQAIVRMYPEVSRNLAAKLKQSETNIPYIVGIIGEDDKLIHNFNLFDLKNKQFKCLIISCPVKNKITSEINFHLLKQSIVVIEDYMKSFNLEKVVVSAPKVNSTNNIIFI